jgi:hypothetical protein
LSSSGFCRRPVLPRRFDVQALRNLEFEEASHGRFFVSDESMPMRRWGAIMKWITRERPKIDRIACPWLIARHIDPNPEFLFVPSAQVLPMAAQVGATPYDIPGAVLSHRGELCSFDAFLADYALRDPLLEKLAVIVRGADTGRLDIAPQSAGLLAVSLGLSVLYQDDHEMLRHGMTIYDAFFAWLKGASDESHNWQPAS